MGYNGNVVVVDRMREGSALYIYGHSRATILPDSVAYALKSDRKGDTFYLPRVIVSHLTDDEDDDGLTGVGISVTRTLGDCPDIEIDPLHQTVRYYDLHSPEESTEWVPYELFIEAVKNTPDMGDYERPHNIVKYIRARS